MKLINRSKKAALIGVVGLLTAVVPGSPAHATAQADIVTINAPGGATGIAECVGVGVTQNASSMDLVVRGTATIAGATNVSLVCHVWQTSPGPKHADIGGVGGPGFAAAAGVARNLHLAQYSICAEVFIVTPSGSAHIKCPNH